MQHREYVGGMWESIGRLQFDFLINQGMKPESILLDIACGCLRLGVHAIPYLNKGCYLGIDKSEALIVAGLEYELHDAIRREKEPHFVISSTFDFDRFKLEPDFTIAQSLFTHLTSDRIERCFYRISKLLKQKGVFFAPFFEAAVPQENPSESHDHKNFKYTRDEMLNFGKTNGLNAQYIGDWNHPRDQVIVSYYK